MIHRKTNAEIAIMREGGAKLSSILSRLLSLAQPGVILNDLDNEAELLISHTGGAPSFKTVKGYHWSTCLCVNEVVVHGIPTNYALQAGDMLTIDIGLLFGGFHTDTAWTKIIGTDSSPQRHAKELFLKVGQDALTRAISLATVGNRVGDLSFATQHRIEEAGYNVVKSLVGHGVGHDLHEDPQIPNYIRGAKENTYRFQGGETIAIEPIYVMGQGLVVYENDDGWTMSTRDRSLAAVFEHTIAVTPDGPIILTTV